MLYCFSTKQDIIIIIIIIIIILCKIWVPQVVPEMKGRNLDKWKKKKNPLMMVEVYTGFNWQNLGIVP